MRKGAGNMDRDFEIVLNALLMLTGARAPIVVKDVATDTPEVRRYLPVLSAGDFDLEDPLERVEWQGDGCDPDTEEPFHMAALDFEETGDVARLIPEDGRPWADALKAIVADAFGRRLDAWAEENGFYGCGRQSAAI